ncbi:hypothetical protein O3P16_00255 [Chitinophagaceae bacterium LY-5]|uniref:Uncharacterized protein n=1 Tax=Polluticaenibacter yanchengensis TaxID=3014562 RepID=A0ABT4UEE0_9BACT|nr:hypothetical protein [Chitinophagaceae bacterium LY-5]
MLCANNITEDYIVALPYNNVQISTYRIPIANKIFIRLPAMEINGVTKAEWLRHTLVPTKEAVYFLQDKMKRTNDYKTLLQKYTERSGAISRPD